MIGMECPCKSVSGAEPETSRDSKEAAISERDVQLPSQGDDANDELCGNAATKSASSPSSSGIVGSVDPECGNEDTDDVNLMCDESILSLDLPAVGEREWLTEEKRRNLFTKKAGCGLVEAQPRAVGEISSGLSLLMDYNSPDGSPCDSPAKRESRCAADVFNFALPLNRSGLCGLDLLALACERKEEEQPAWQSGGEDSETTLKAELMEQQEEKESKTSKYCVFLTFMFADQTMQCDHSLKSHWTVLSCGAVCFVIQCGSNFLVCASNHAVWPFFGKLLNSTFMWWCLFCDTVWF